MLLDFKSILKRFLSDSVNEFDNQIPYAAKIV